MENSNGLRKVMLTIKQKPERILYSIVVLEFVINFFTSNEKDILAQILYSLGSTIGLLAIIFIICLLTEGIYFLVTKKFSWYRFSKVAIVLYFILKIVNIYTANAQTNEKETTIKLFKEYVNDLTTQRKEYKLRVDSISQTQLDGLQSLKDLTKLIIIKSNINRQRVVDTWNYNIILHLTNKWDVIFKKQCFQASNIDVQNFYKKYHSNNFADNEDVKKIISTENEWLNSYENFINFLITNNDEMKLIDNNLVMSTKDLSDEYAILFKKYSEAEKTFIDFLNYYKNTHTSKVKELNSTLGIKEVNDAIKAVE